MLDYFKNEQPIAYKILTNSVSKNKVSHAYLFESNGYSKTLELAKAFSKCLFCPKNYTNSNNCGECSQCLRIDNNEFIELKIIEAEGQWIKKTQLEELQDLFSKKSIIGNRKVYIINGADKLNTSSSNSLLKFLEEPEEGIIAILIVEKASQLLDTIVSRCQVLPLKNKENLENLNTLEKINKILKIEDEEQINIEKIVEFIKFYEENKLNTIVYINKMWHNHFKERKDIYNSFSAMLLFYKDVLNQKTDSTIEAYNDFVNDVVEISKKNEINDVIRKINVIMELREKIKFNINNNILMDKLIIELEGCE